MTISKTWKRDSLTQVHEAQWSDLMRDLAMSDQDEAWLAAERVGFALEALDDQRYHAMNRHREIRQILSDIAAAAA